jgi:hypothetical protein
VAGLRELRALSAVLWVVVGALACTGAGGMGCAVGGGSGADTPTPQPIAVVKPTTAAPFDRTFSWRAVDDATNYRVIVFNAEGERSFEVRDIRGTAVALAESVNLAPGQYSWQVIALKDGVELTQSARTDFTIK